jgi:hypothetical protein
MDSWVPDRPGAYNDIFITILVQENIKVAGTATAPDVHWKENSQMASIHFF